MWGVQQPWTTLTWCLASTGRQVCLPRALPCGTHVIGLGLPSPLRQVRPSLSWHEGEAHISYSMCSSRSGMMSGTSQELEEELFKQERAKPGAGVWGGGLPLCVCLHFWLKAVLLIGPWLPVVRCGGSLPFSECQCSHLQNQDDDGIVIPALVFAGNMQ